MYWFLFLDYIELNGELSLCVQMPFLTIVGLVVSLIFDHLTSISICSYFVINWFLQYRIHKDDSDVIKLFICCIYHVLCPMICYVSGVSLFVTYLLML